MIEYTDFGIKVRSILLKQKRSMTSFAKEELGISCSYLSEILKGTREGTAYKNKIAQILGLDIPQEETKVG